MNVLKRANTAHVVIGANYGDEGKGVLTDYLCSQLDECSVVRFNGGAQAGHTVVAPDGRRHVFGHIGAGALLERPTHLSRFFIVNPLAFNREFDALERLSSVHGPRLSVDPDAFVTTPYDMFVNQLCERKRAQQKHGSCGLGINETVARCLRDDRLCTRARDLINPSQLQAKLRLVETTWLPERLSFHSIPSELLLDDPFLQNQESIIEGFIGECKVFTDRASIGSFHPRGPLIFEGAQGLLLDEDRLEGWPNLTRSKTGLFNVVRLARMFGIDHLNVLYTTRTYLTRHGAGELPGECDWSFPDATNKPNMFQGSLRFAPLDCRSLNSRVICDIRSVTSNDLNISSSYAFTCADQYHLPDRDELALPVKFISFGPTRDDVVASKPEVVNPPCPTSCNSLESGRGVPA